ncbi:DUF4920 domain-containing protein [Filimonas effusa]|uniref:DUF4920 domain-containing protein n=1 Tax=Filimonas effusa TaxID=2508721 RepID=A0A4Q1D8W4_9BACT|nr:DUF4920 domain-containing protein [Filimonas effusa]RXK85650.1 DUF4920 domain-containing protein [Filimonas effusa]
MMKHIITLVVLACLFGVAKAQPPAGPAKPGSTYGATITADGAIPIATLPAQLGDTSKHKTKVTAKVLDVCPKKGCWVKLQVNDTTTAFVKMKDYGFFVPLDMIGKTIVLDGEAYIKETSVKELRHYAEDAKKSKAEIEAIQAPKKEIRFTASGILVIS